jgi:hypothetical protein
MWSEFVSFARRLYALGNGTEGVILRGELLGTVGGDASPLG